MSPAIGQVVRSVRGNSRLPIQSLKGQRLVEIGLWGKHMLLFFTDCVMKIHFLLWGSFRVNSPRPKPAPRMQLNFKNIKIYFYSCSLRFLEQNVDAIYDWTADVMSPSWDEEAAIAKVAKQKKEMACDVLLDQSIFSGVGNIIKNESLFNQLIHPERLIADLSIRKIRSLVREAHEYSWKFYEWKKAFELKKHWRIMRKRECPRCGGRVTRKITGQRRRLSHFCPRCQH